MRYKDLSQYEGLEVDFIKGYSSLTELDGERVPDKCIFVKDYPDTVLVKWIYIYDVFGGKKDPRTIMKMIPKAAMYVGDVLIKGDRLLTGAMVRG